MSTEPAREFVDTNVLVCAFDPSAEAKHAMARRLLERLWEQQVGCLSIQILQEFFVVVTRKVPRPLSIESAADRIRELAVWRVFAPTADDVMAAIALQKKAALGFWDAMVVHAAAELGSDILWTEDRTDGQVLRGVRISNPFSITERQS